MAIRATLHVKKGMSRINPLFEGTGLNLAQRRLQEWSKKGGEYRKGYKKAHSKLLATEGRVEEYCQVKYRLRGNMQRASNKGFWWKS